MCRRKGRRLLLLIPIIFLIIVVVILFSNKDVAIPMLQTLSWSPSSELPCHSIRTQESLPDITDNPPNNTENRNIFFLETSCKSYNMGKLFIKARQACAVESAARMNPDMEVYLLFASPGVIKDEGSQSDRILSLLSNYSNIKLMYLNVDKYIKDTPVEKLWLENKIQQSKFAVAHNSDTFRLLTLWKYGGIYLDLDVVVVKSFSDVPDNFAGAESGNLLGNAVMGFSPYGIGRLYVNECLTDLADNFDGSQWNYNGPKLLTRNILKHCPNLDLETMVRFGKCDEFRVFPPTSFYSVPYQTWQWFFDPKMNNDVVGTIEELSYLTHIWNKLTYNKSIRIDDGQVPYLKLANKFCPGVVQEIDEFF